MKGLSLKERLLRFLLARHGFVSSGDLQRVVMENTSYLPRTTVRRLQEMFEDGILERELRHGTAFYKAKDGVAAPKLPSQNHLQGVGYLPSYEEIVAKGTIVA